MKEMEGTIRNLRKEIKQKEKNKDKEIRKMVKKILSQCFTPGQVKQLIKQKRVKWTAEDVQAAITLRCMSPKAYRYMRKIRKIPLPAESTLRKWCFKFDVQPGILKKVLKVMKEKGQNLSTAKKLTVLSFDEVHISNKYDMDKKHQRIYGSHKKCQFVMARGLFQKWKQPVYYDFDQKMTKEILHKIIKSLYDIGYIVVSVVSDMGPDNINLWNQVGIGVNQKGTKIKSSIEHPSDPSLRIHFFADVPHLLKLLRNNFLDSGFNYRGILLTKHLVDKLLKINSKELKFAFRISAAHINCSGSQRQNVQLAAQFFSRTNSKAIEYSGVTKLFPGTNEKEWRLQAYVFGLINDWFDLLNTKIKYEKNGAKGYGIDLESQNSLIEEMNTFIKEMRAGSRKSLMPFQKGILLSNQSLMQLLPFLRSKFKIDDSTEIQYILTRLLDQDILENFFAHLRSMGGTYDHPTPVEITNRLKWYILGRNADNVISERTNTQKNDITESLVSLEDLQDLEEEDDGSAPFMRNLQELCDDGTGDPDNISSQHLFNETDVSMIAAEEDLEIWEDLEFEEDNKTEGKFQGTYIENEISL